MLKQGMPPVHPGEILKEMYLDPLGVNNTRLADNLGVARKTVSQLINGHMGVSAEMALRLAKAFDTTPELWLNLQRNYDLWYASTKITVSKVRSFRGIIIKRTGSKTKSVPSSGRLALSTK